MKMCKVHGCNQSAYRCGYCCRHEQQDRVYGKILNRTKFDKNEMVVYDDYAEVILYNIKNKEVERTQFDLQDVSLIQEYHWGLSTGYAVTYIKGNLVFMHNLLLGCYAGVADHKDRNRLNNRRYNICMTTQQINLLNRGLYKNNKSGVKGVRFHVKRNKWLAELALDGVKLYEFFSTFEEAVVARSAAEEQYHKPLLNNR